MMRLRLWISSMVVALVVVLGVVAARGAASAQPVTGQPAASRGSVPGFLEVNKRYSIRWAPGDNEIYRVLEIRDGWARGRRDPANAAQEGAKPIELWLNPAQAITITEQP